MSFMILYPISSLARLYAETLPEQYTIATRSKPFENSSHASEYDSLSYVSRRITNKDPRNITNESPVMSTKGVVFNLTVSLPGNLLVTNYTRFSISAKGDSQSQSSLPLSFQPTDLNDLGQKWNHTEDGRLRVAGEDNQYTQCLTQDLTKDLGTLDSLITSSCEEGGEGDHTNFNQIWEFVKDNFTPTGIVDTVGF
ncbi:uncharacterized protein IL334_002813 [Kwoniella shivajii]|uniref:Uncharacterized protein n=1 Tax=Kwoniella shivajii TaxID=564305 RepID=A0ABZ1CZX7_9TREE|nr:hypothetical protein IL334_002813 [Kwoniella shivajii]